MLFNCGRALRWLEGFDRSWSRHTYAKIIIHLIRQINVILLLQGPPVVGRIRRELAAILEQEGIAHISQEYRIIFKIWHITIFVCTNYVHVNCDAFLLYV